MQSVYDTFGCSCSNSNLINPLAPRYVGLECEIEGVLSHNHVEKLGFVVTDDGSLRNSGKEYITPPVTLGEASEMFKGLHATIRTDKSLKFSQRTSIHVHVNCLPYMLDRVKNVILMYALYEEAFFLLVDADRRDNIHCVPLTETYLPSLYREQLPRLVERWHKYTALNIKPLSQYGTIEFRHMQGHEDSVLMDEWLGVINRLFMHGLSTEQITADNLTEEKLKAGFDFIFGDSRLKDQWVLVRGLMVNAIIDIKLAV